MHVLPSVCLIGLIGSERCIVAYSCKYNLDRYDIAIVTVLSIYGKRLHGLVDLDNVISGKTYNRLKVCYNNTIFIKVVLITVNILPACYYLIVIEIILIVIIVVSPAGKRSAVKGLIACLAVCSDNYALKACCLLEACCRTGALLEELNLHRLDILTCTECSCCISIVCPAKLSSVIECNLVEYVIGVSSVTLDTNLNACNL